MAKNDNNGDPGFFEEEEGKPVNDASAAPSVAVNKEIKALVRSVEGLKAQVAPLVERDVVTAQQLNERIQQLERYIADHFSDEAADENELFIQSTIQKAVKSVIAETTQDYRDLHQEMFENISSLVGRVTAEIEQKNLELEEKQAEIETATTALFNKAVDLKINAWWSLPAFGFRLIAVFVFVLSLIWLIEGTFTERWIAVGAAFTQYKE